MSNTPVSNEENEHGCNQVNNHDDEKDLLIHENEKFANKMEKQRLQQQKHDFTVFMYDDEISNHTGTRKLSQFLCFFLLLSFFAIIIILKLNYHIDNEMIVDNPSTIYDTQGLKTSPINPPDKTPWSDDSESQSHINHEKISHLKGEFKNSPIIVGGVGDSGTRAVYYMLQEIGVNMMMPPYAAMAVKDSVIFMNTKHYDPRRERHGEAQVDIFNGSAGIDHIMQPDDFFEFRKANGDFSTSPKFLYANSIWSTGDDERTGSLCGYDRNTVNSIHGNFWEWGINFTSGILKNHNRIARIQHIQHPSNKPGYGLYGFKHPRSALMLPYIQEAVKRLGYAEEDMLIKNKRGNMLKVTRAPFKFIHVIRDGRDTAFADNDNFYETICCLLYHTSKDDNCKENHQQSEFDQRCGITEANHKLYYHSLTLQFHQDANAQLMEWGVRELGLLHGYFPLRIEDFVLMKENGVNCLNLLFDFLDLDSPDEELVQSIIEIFDGHEGSFAGQDLSNKKRNGRTKSIFVGDPKSTGDDYWGFDLFGYLREDFGMSLQCLDWIKHLPKLLKTVMKKNETSNEYYKEGRKDWRQRHKKGS